MRTTDNLSEVFEIVDENDNVIGQTTRGEAHWNNKLIHRSIGVVIFNSKGEVFLQQRSATKDTDPLKWTISCSGHVNKNPKSKFQISNQIQNPKSQRENLKIYEETAHRELVEELGVDLEIVPVAKYLWRSERESEMVMIFKAFSDGSFILNKQEIIQGKFFTQKRLIEAIKSGKIDLNNWGKMALGKIGWRID